MTVASLSLPVCAAVLLLLPAAACAAEGCSIVEFLYSWPGEQDPWIQPRHEEAAGQPAFEGDRPVEPAPVRLTVGVAGELVPIADGPRIRIPFPPRLPVPPRLPSPPAIGLPTHGLAAPRAYYPGYKSPAVAWMLSFFVPGVGQFYVGGRSGVILGTVHLSIFATLLSGMLLFADGDEDVMLACAVGSVVNWMVSWIEAIILAGVHNRYAYSFGLAADYDADTKALGLGVRARF